MRRSPHLVMTIDDTRLAVPEDRVDDVITGSAITETPLAPAPVAGLTNRHGEVVVVIDLRCALGLEDGEHGADATVVFVDTAVGSLGLLVESIVAPTLLPAEHLQSPPLTMVAPARRMIAGIARLDDQLLAIVDVDAIAAEVTTPVPSIA